MTNAFSKLGEFVSMGGFSMLSAGVDQVMGRLKDQVANGLESALAPLIGEVMNAVNEVFSEVGKVINDFTTTLDSISLTLPHTGTEISLLDQGLNGLKASFGGIFTFIPGMIHQFQIMAEEIQLAAAAANDAAAAQDALTTAFRKEPSGQKILDIERGLM